MTTAHLAVLLSALIGGSDITISPSRGDRAFALAAAQPGRG